MNLKRVVSLFMVILLIFGNACFFTEAFAAEKETKTRTIAIVHDNSGSMYMNKNKAWCQAQYAIEVFADMMNEGDKLMVYPMWPVSADGSTVYTYQDNPVVITEDNQKTALRTLKSDLTNGDYTPIESIDAAHQGLVASGGEKWLVVLTDGQTFYENQQELNPQATKSALEERFSTYSPDTNILYLGIGENLEAPQIAPADNSFYAARTTTSQNVPIVLTEMCNIIFGRDALPDNHKTDSTVDFDIPLSKLYVFIQGEGIDNVELTKDGKGIKPTKTYTPEYGTAGCDSPYAVVLDYLIDTTLKGYIAVYKDLQSGVYNYSYTGSMSSIEFYYEVDADLQLDLINENGQSVNSAAEVAPGDYKIRYALVDKNGNILKSDLLGKVNYDIGYTVNGEAKTETSSESGEMPIHIDENTEFAVNYAEVNFLNGYKIRKEGTGLGFLSIPFKGIKGAAKTMSVILSGGAEIVDADCLADVPPYVVRIVYDGSDVTGEQLNSVNLNVTVSDPSMYCDIAQTDIGFELKLKLEEGLTVAPEGTHEISVNAVYSSEKIEDSSADASVSIIVNMPVDNLDVEFVEPVTVFSTMGIKNAPKLIAKLTYNGAPLTEEQFASMNFSASSDGPDLILEPLPGESAYSISIDPEGNLDTGNYTINCEASGITARSGEELIAKTDLGVKIQVLPQWVKVILYFLAGLLLLLIIILIARIPTLPNKIALSNISVRVDGEEMKNLKANVIYPRKGKRREIKIKGTGDLSNANFKATLVPPKDSYLYLPSKKRKAMVVNGTVRASGYVDSISVGSEKYVRDDANKLIRVSQKEKDFNFPKGRITFSGQKDINGMPADYSITGDIKFE